METKEKIAIVGFSFASGEKEPNPCNKRLAEEVIRIAKMKREQGFEVLIMAQWEISKALQETINYKPSFTVFEHMEEGKYYLDSDEVARQTAAYLKKEKVKKVIIAANPFIHLFVCRRLFKKAGFIVLKEKIKWIGFYKNSLQWWTRGPVRLIVYIILAVLFGRRGH